MIKIVSLTLLFSFVILLVKGFNNEFAMILGIVSSVILIFISLGYFENVFNFFNEIINDSGVDKSLYSIIFKITGIGYLIEFSASLIEDAGIKNLSDKLILIGKLIIISTSLPVFYYVINMFSEILL